MKREFLINILFLLAVNLLIKPFYLFGIDRGVQNTVSPEDYGIYFALFNFTFLFQIITDFGIQNFNNRNLSQHRQLLDKYLPNMLVLKALLALLYMIVVVISAIIAGYERIYFHLLLIIACNQILASLLLYLRTNISGLGMYRLDSLLSVTDRLLLIIICGVLLWTPVVGGEFRIEWFAYAQTFALGVTALIAFIIANRHTRAWQLKFNRALLLFLLKKSWPYALAVFLMSVYNRVDGVMIERLLTDGQLEASIYASAYRLFEASNMIGFLFASLLLPIFSRMLKEEEPLNELVAFSYQMVAAGAILLIGAVVVHRVDIMEALYVSGTVYSGQVLMYLMLSFFAVSGTYILGTLLVANDSLKFLNYVFTLGLVLNVILNLILIPNYKAEGAAIATCVTQFTVFIAEVILTWRLLKLKLPMRLVGNLLLFLFINIILSYSIKFYVPVVWWMQFVCTLIITGLIALILRLVDIRQLMHLRQA
jgi:O-antigen/teichoic acid export membrane protein